MSKHLWEIEHPYCGPEACYYASGDDARASMFSHDSWTEFATGESFYNADLDMNYLYRWDWLRDSGEFTEPGEECEPDRLVLFYMGQRKGYMSSTTIFVTEDDEPAVREWLAVRAAHTATMWDPFLVPADV